MKTPRDGLSRVLEVLDLLEIPYLIGGSVASSVHGIARPTMDTDIVVDLRIENVPQLVGLLKSDFYVDQETVSAAIRLGRAVNIIHFDSSYKFDLFPLQTDEFSRLEFGRRSFLEIRPFGEPIECAVASAEDVLLRKLVWYRKGGEISERQWNDVRGLLNVQKSRLDYGYLQKWSVYLRVEDLLSRLISGG